jgi:uncharacterized protein (DUF2252 family)
VEHSIRAHYRTEQNGTERNGTERNGTERNGTERNGTVRVRRNLQYIYIDDARHKEVKCQRICYEAQDGRCK